MSKRLNVVIMLLFLLTLSGCVGPVSFNAENPNINSSYIQNGKYELTDEDTISEEISGEILRRERDAEVNSELRIYRKYTMTSNSTPISDNYSNKSTRQIINESDIDIEELINISELAERDGVLTEESIKELRKDNISVWRIIDNSDVELDELVNRDEIIRRAEGGEIEKANDRRLESTYVVFIAPNIQTTEGSAEIGPRDVQEINAFIEERTGDRIKIGEKIGDEDGIEIYEATSPKLGQIEVVFSKKKINGNSILSFGYYNRSDKLRDEMVSIVADTGLDED